MTPARERRVPRSDLLTFPEPGACRAQPLPRETASRHRPVARHAMGVSSHGAQSLAAADAARHGAGGRASAHITDGVIVRDNAMRTDLARPDRAAATLPPGRVAVLALALSGGLACGPRPAQESNAVSDKVGPSSPPAGPSTGPSPDSSASTADATGTSSQGSPSRAQDPSEGPPPVDGATPRPPDEPPSLSTLPNGVAIAACEDPPPDMACVPGGPFVRGRDDGGQKNEQPAMTIHLQTFYMDKWEVTNAQYRACRDAGACPKRGPLYNDFSRARQPITGVSWDASVAYCAWVGKSLPTEAQWEKAARGPDGDLYPWGNETASCDKAIIEDARGRSCGIKKLKEHPDKGRTFEVGSRPAQRYGLYDMSGNVWEWVYDWASPSWSACGKACEGVDPRGPCDGRVNCPGKTERVVRGGSWYYVARYATGSYRRTHVPDNPHENFHHFGFRCAATVDEARARKAAITAGTAQGLVQALDKPTPDAQLGR